MSVDSTISSVVLVDTVEWRAQERGGIVDETTHMLPEKGLVLQPWKEQEDDWFVQLDLPDRVPTGTQTIPALCLSPVACSVPQLCHI